MTAPTKVVDWRVWKAGTVAGTKPTPLGSGTVKPGDVFYVVTSTVDSAVGRVDFITPSPTALTLNIAVQAALDAARLRAGLHFKETGTAGGSKWVEEGNLDSLFNYFEKAMIASVFSFQSLETFANQVIAEQLKGSLTLKRRDGDVEMTADDIQRRVSTEEKLATVLPTIGNMKSPKGTKMWQNFVVLNSVRDSTVHLKSQDQYVRNVVDKQTLYYQFMNHNPKEFPKHAIALINYFSGAQPNVWAAAASDLLNA